MTTDINEIFPFVESTDVCMTVFKEQSYNHHANELQYMFQEEDKKLIIDPWTNIQA